MTNTDDEHKTRRGRAQAIGLFRYLLIREAADPALSARQRGAMVRQIAAQPQTDPSGRRIRISRWTLDRRIAAWHSGGFDALVPSPAAVPVAHPRRGDDAGGGAEEGEPGPLGGPGPADPACRAGLGAR